MHRVPILFVVLWLIPLQSSAIGLITFDSARLAAEEVELGASLNGATMHGQARYQVDSGSVTVLSSA